MSAQEENRECQELLARSDWDSNDSCPLLMKESNLARLLSFFRQYGKDLSGADDINKLTYNVVQRLDVMDAGDTWGFTIENNTRKLYTGIFVYVVFRSYDYLTAINLSHVAEFENVSIYTDKHSCDDNDNDRTFEGSFLDTMMLEALASCKQLEKISMCSCLVPRYCDDQLASIFKANKNLVHLRLMSFQLSGNCLLSIRKPEEMVSLFLIKCWIPRKYLLRGLRRMKKLNVLSLRSTIMSEDVYSPMKMQISKFLKRMGLDWFEMLSDYLPVYLFEKKRLNLLTVLSVDYAGDCIDDHAMKYIADNCKMLMVFSSKQCTNVTDEGFVPIFNLRMLRYIDVSYTNVTDLALQGDVSRELTVLICHMCRFTSDGLKTMLRGLDKFKVIDAYQCSQVDDDLIAYLLTYSNDSLDRLVTARVSETGVNFQRVHFTVPLPNLKLITRSGEQLEVDYRNYLEPRHRIFSWF